MKVQVLFFGATAEATGKREVEIEAENNAKADAVFAQVVANYPQLAKHSLLFAVNQEYTKGDETIKDGDELAVFTHVSGG
jgi:molybdopterin converting factor small subunit